MLRNCFMKSKYCKISQLYLHNTDLYLIYMFYYHLMRNKLQDINLLNHLCCTYNLYFINNLDHNHNNSYIHLKFDNMIRFIIKFIRCLYNMSFNQL